MSRSLSAITRHRRRKSMRKRKQKQQQEQTTGNLFIPLWLHSSHCVVIIYLSFLSGNISWFLPSNYSILFPSLHSWFQFWFFCDTGELTLSPAVRVRHMNYPQNLFLSVGLTQVSTWAKAVQWVNPSLSGRKCWYTDSTLGIEKHVPLRAAGCNTDSS